MRPNFSSASIYYRAAEGYVHAQGKNLSEFDHVKRGLALVGAEKRAV